MDLLRQEGGYQAEKGGRSSKDDEEREKEQVMDLIIEEEVERTVSELGSAADEKRREKAKGYYPTSFHTLGVKVPDQKKVTNSLRKRIKGEPLEERIALAKALVDTSVFECQQTAYELLSKDREALHSLAMSDLYDLRKGLDNWVSVDTFSALLAGVAWREGRISDDTLKGWAASEDRWIRRSSLVCTIALNQKARGGRGDVNRTLMVCRLLAEDRDEMVAKALSWALRELSKIDKEPVIGFIEEHRDVLPKRVLREVGRKLDTGRKN
ncbi:MAG: DNA alkylation repair protein [Thermoplasmatota archaeon]